MRRWRQVRLVPGSVMADEQIKQYRILGKLGAGAMGEVYLAKDTQLERQVAIRQVVSSGGEPAASSRMIAPGHPND